MKRIKMKFAYKNGLIYFVVDVALLTDYFKITNCSRFRKSCEWNLIIPIQAKYFIEQTHLLMFSNFN